MPPIGEDSPANCRWAERLDDGVAESQLVDLPLCEQVARGKELLSMLMEPPASKPLAGEAPRRAVLPQPPRPGMSRGLWNEGGLTRQLREGDALRAELPPPGFEANGMARGTADWLSQPQFPSRPSEPASALGPLGPSPPGIWGPGGPGSGTWAPLSTNPTGTSSSWLRTGAPERTAANGTPAGAEALTTNSSCTSSVPYPAGPVTTDAGLAGGWSTPATLSGAPWAMVAGGAAQASQHLMSQGSHQLRADAAPYTPADAFAEGAHVY